MLIKEEKTIDSITLHKFFRSFELSTEYRELMYARRSVFYKFPRLIKGLIEYQFLNYYFAKVPKWRLFVRRLLSEQRIAPNYIMTGPIKSGSSDLVSHLLLHPNIMPPLAKEVKIQRLKNWRVHYPTVKEMQNLEEKIGGPVKCGYLEPVLHNLEVMNTLYELNPNSKVIITLRDPVARAYSYWKWEILIGGEWLKNSKMNNYLHDFTEYVERAIDLFPSIPMETVCASQVLDTGIYYKAVEYWINRFGRENVLVLDVAEYFQNRQPVFEKIQRFLELPIVQIPEYGKKANENPIKLPPPDEKAIAALKDFYQPYNQKLFALICEEFNW